MADVRPFNGIHYNPGLLEDWRKVICPVYDIIPPGQHERLYAISEHNFVRLEAGRELPQDTPGENKYTRAAATLAQWLSQGILQQDARPAIYVHDHYFDFKGKRHKRRGIIARVRLEDWESKVVRPHESTLADARTDRLNLLWAAKVNTSSIMSLYEDPGSQISSLLDRQTGKTPDYDLALAGGEAHRLWAITDAGALRTLSGLFANLPLYIADGHHRYESALNYRRQRRESAGPTGEHPFDFVMMTLIDFDDPGLLILPPHRLVRGVSREALDCLKTGISSLFNFERVPYSAKALEDFGKGSGVGPTTQLFLYGMDGENVLVLSPRDNAAIESMMPHFHSALYRKLEVSIIDHVVLDNLLALNHDRDKVNLGYSYDADDAIGRVVRGEYQLAFLLTPIRSLTIKAIADLGEKMPKKSTYFYPKVPAGLIVNRID
jgi:uncharacterized protein (DUF1015 family)